MSDLLASLSVQEDLVDDTRAIAEELDISPDRLVALAIEDFVSRYRKRQQLMRDINAAYEGDPDTKQVALQRAMRNTQRRIVEGEW